MSDSEQDEIVKEFLVEAQENLDQLDRELMALEAAPSTPQLLASVFRRVHTIKGACGFLGFGKLESVAHVAENLLSKLRDEEIELTATMVTTLLQTADTMREVLAGIESDGKEGDKDYSALIATLNRLQSGREVAEPPAAAPPSPAATPEKLGPAPVPAAALTPSSAAPPPAPQAPAAGVAAPHQHAPSPAAAAPVPRPAPPAAPAPPRGPEAPAAARAQSDGAEHKPHAVSDSSLRVDVGLLDKLMNLVGELVLARNQVLQVAPTVADPNFAATSQRLNLITTELQSGVMKTRMQPIGNIWEKLPRVVRDLALTCGKQVRVEMTGSETELDKTIIEAIKDPLTHLVRNCVDHGIEPAASRVAAAKPPEGRLSLRAYHEGGQVIIEISDDGRGLNLDAIRKKALERNLITAEQSARMSERDLQNLIFLPGFSTAEKVSNVSGRGVGMDVVRTNIEKIGGVVDVQTALGNGTTFRIKIPLTLAIIPALIVTSGGDRYAVPQISLLELVRLKDAQARDRIETIQGVPVYRLRGNLLPLVYLNQQLDIESGVEGSPDAVNIVVLHAENRTFGLVVDQVNDTEEIVVKPLGQHLKGISAFAGATIMGDGRVALILDILGIAQQAGVVSGAHERSLPHESRASGEPKGRRQTLLLFQARDGRRMAIPLSAVARLEEFSTDSLENLGNRQVIQYRGGILPLVEIGQLVGGGAGTMAGGTDALPDEGARNSLHVIVYSEGQRSVGLIVGKILDIVEEDLDASSDGQGGLPLGCAVIQRKVTEIINLRGLVQRQGGELFEIATAPPAEMTMGA